MPEIGDTEYRYSIGINYDGIVSSDNLIQHRYSDIAYISWYIRGGGVRVETAGTNLRVGPGDWVFFDPLTVKSHVFQRDTRLISIRFRLDWHSLPFLPPLSKPRLYRGDLRDAMVEAAERLCALEKQVRTEGKPHFPSVECRRTACLSEWLYYWHLVREQDAELAPASVDQRVYEIMAILGERPGMKVLDYDRLSKAVSLSRVQINRIFKDASGLTPRQWCDAHCLRAAEDWLRGGELSLKEIADRLGFFDASHFTKWFKVKMGLTPRDWRRIKMEGV